MKDFKKIICVLIALCQTFMLVSCGKEPIEMVNIPGKDYKMSTTEITQKFYESVMGENPSYFKGENNPVGNVSWYDAIYFCNKLSEKCGYTPVYSVNGTTDVTKWNYTPHQKEEIKGEVTQNTSANGFRLPTEAEWEYAAKGGQNYKYAGSDNIDEVAWYEDNSVETTHPVAQKKANGYGLYDMSGNVEEWCWDSSDSGGRRFRGGSWYYSEDDCTVFDWNSSYAFNRYDDSGFRVVRTAKEKVGRSLKHTQKVSIQEAVNILETLPNEPIKLIVIDELNEETAEKFETFLHLLENHNIKVSLDLSKLKVSSELLEEEEDLGWWSKNAYGLINIIFPKWITSIDGYGFSDCANLTSVIIPDSVTSIGDYAFSGCDSLTNITIPDSVTSIGEDAFFNCENLIYNEYQNGLYLGNKNNPYYALIKVKNKYITFFEINNKTKIFSSDAFAECEDIKTLVLGNGITSLDNLPIPSTLESIIIGSGVTSIGEDAFSDWKNLTSVTIPDSVTSIDEWAFSYCKSLTNITIPDSVTSIGDYAFHYCDNLTRVTIGSGVTSIGDYAFSGCDSLTNITIPDSVTSIGDYAFSYCKSLTNITIPDSVTSIGEEAFSGCDSLTNITIPDSVTSIGEGAFYDCSESAIFDVSVHNPKYSSSADGKILYNKDKTTLILYPSATVNIVIPDSVTSISESAFSGCKNLIYNEYGNGLYLGNKNNPYLALIKAKSTGITSCEIHASTKAICRKAFSGCDSLTNITIPDSVTSIGKWTFSGCDSLTNITIPDSVTSIGKGAFSGCSNLTSVTIPDSVTSIGDYAFSGCDSLTNITIPDCVTSISESAFSGCDSLTSVTIPDSVTSIGENAFDYCDNLTRVTIGSGVTSIGDYAFSYCKSLTNITIPDSVTSIGKWTFSGCDSLTNITIPDSVTSIGKGAFSGCSNLTSVTIPDSVTSIGRNAFSGCSYLRRVNYKGTKEQWKQININLYSNKRYTGNKYLINANKNYGYTGE